MTLPCVPPPHPQFWFGKWRSRDAEQFLLGRDAVGPHYLAGDAVRGLLQDATRGALPRERQLMSLYVLEEWLRKGAGRDSRVPVLVPA